MTVRFYEEIEDSLLKFAVIIAKKDGKFIFCKHRERETYEIPGGHREPGESVFEAAERELYEETGAVGYEIRPICVYSVLKDGCDESFGMLYFAEVKELEAELHSEIEKIVLMDALPESWTYPDIQPKLMLEAERRGFI